MPSCPLSVGVLENIWRTRGIVGNIRSRDRSRTSHLADDQPLCARQLGQLAGGSLRAHGNPPETSSLLHRSVSPGYGAGGGVEGLAPGVLPWRAGIDEPGAGAVEAAPVGDGVGTRTGPVVEAQRHEVAAYGIDAVQRGGHLIGVAAIIELRADRDRLRAGLEALGDCSARRTTTRPDRLPRRNTAGSWPWTFAPAPTMWSLEGDALQADLHLVRSNPPRAS